MVHILLKLLIYFFVAQEESDGSGSSIDSFLAEEDGANGDEPPFCPSEIESESVSASPQRTSCPPVLIASAVLPVLTGRRRLQRIASDDEDEGDLTLKLIMIPLRYADYPY